MDDVFDQFLIKAVLALVAGLILIGSSSCAHSKFAIQNAIVAGVDPIIARCAIVGAGESNICFFAITHQKEQ